MRFLSKFGPSFKLALIRVSITAFIFSHCCLNIYCTEREPYYLSCKKSLLALRIFQAVIVMWCSLLAASDRHKKRKKGKFVFSLIVSYEAAQEMNCERQKTWVWQLSQLFLCISGYILEQLLNMLRYFWM